MIVKVILDKSKAVKSILKGVKEVKFLIFYLLLINLDLYYFLRNIYIYRKRERDVRPPP